MAIDAKKFLTAINDNEKVSNARADLKTKHIYLTIGEKENKIIWDDRFLEKETLGKIRGSKNIIHMELFKVIIETVKFIKSKNSKPSVKKEIKEPEGKVIIPQVKKGENDMVYSYSKRSTYLTSPRDYFLRYVFKMDGKTKGIQKKQKSSALFIGSVFHEFLEVYYTAQQYNFTKSDAYELALLDFEITWTEDKKRELENQTTKKGTMLDDLLDSKKYFEHYYSYYKNDDFDEVVFAEVSFLSELYKFDDEDLKDFRFLQHIKADLLVKDKGVYKLVEHKTHSQDRTADQRISPQTLEYVEGIQKDLGIKIHSIVFNEIRKAKPKAFTLLKSGKVSTAKNKIVNFSRVALDEQYKIGTISEEDYRDGLECVNMDYYFHREERLVNEQAQKQFSQEMKYSTKALARTLVKEYRNEKEGKKDNALEYPINWTTNKKFGSEFEQLYISFFEGMDNEAIGDLLRASYKPKEFYEVNGETPLQRINRLAALKG